MGLSENTRFHGAPRPLPFTASATTAEGAHGRRREGSAQSDSGGGRGEYRDIHRKVGREEEEDLGTIASLSGFLAASDSPLEGEHGVRRI